MISVDVWKDNYCALGIYIEFDYYIDVHSHSNAAELHVPKNISSLIPLAEWISQNCCDFGSVYLLKSQQRSEDSIPKTENHDFIIQLNIYYHVS